MSIEHVIKDNNLQKLLELCCNNNLSFNSPVFTHDNKEIIITLNHILKIVGNYRFTNSFNNSIDLDTLNTILNVEMIEICKSKMIDKEDFNNFFYEYINNIMLG